MFEKLTTAHTNNPSIAWQMQFQTLHIGLDITDGKAQTLTIGPGDITLSDGLTDNCDLVFSGTNSAWQEFAKTTPAVGYQSLTAMCEKDNMEVAGTNILALVQHNMMLEKIFSNLRTQRRITPPKVRKPYIETTAGHYLHLNLEGRAHRIYFEEAGSGTPLLCLHTAGSDGRQYRALMNDAEITAKHRVIVFDMPAHGKSSPPAGYECEHYVLTTERYVAMVMAIKEALELDKPIVMGCSIGGRVVLHLALQHPDAFHAAIGLQSATHAESHLEAKLGILSKFPLHRPDMHGNEIGASLMRHIMSPHAPSHHYWETIWHYTQGGPGVFAGDLNYYMVDGDMRNGIAEKINTNRCPVYLLTGEYDLSATPEMTAELAKTINAQHFEVMKGLGHFPMSEDPEKFRTYLLPVLEKIRAQAS